MEKQEASSQQSRLERQGRFQPPHRHVRRYQARGYQDVERSSGRRRPEEPQDVGIGGSNHHYPKEREWRSNNLVPSFSSSTTTRDGNGRAKYSDPERTNHAPGNNRGSRNSSSSSPGYSPARASSDWKCLECCIWNYPDEKRCHRCGVYLEDMYPIRPATTCDGREDRHGNAANEKRSFGEVVRSDGVHEDDFHSDDYDYEDNNSAGDELGGNPNAPMELDEFGRAIPPSSSSKSSSKKLKRSSHDTSRGGGGERHKKTNEWPPCFDGIHGAEYILDNRSGMFYHADSDFFYDPQTKLYYGNKQASYFRYDKNESPPFCLMEGASTADGGHADAGNHKNLDLLVDAHSGIIANKTTSKPSISINLKTKKLPKTSQKKKAATATTTTADDTATTGVSNTNPLHRQHQVDIHKWSERQEEMKQLQQQQQQQQQGGQTQTGTDQSATSQSVSLDVVTADQKSQEEPSEKKPVPTTAKGEPICVLCQRKFPTLEKLKYHERVSKLHVDNLKKQDAKQPNESLTDNDTKPMAANEPRSSSGVESDPSVERKHYVDRAQQRRLLYGDDATTTTTTTTSLRTVPAQQPRGTTADPSGPPNAAAVIRSSEEALPPEDVVRPEELLGTRNVGNQMLQKLGWKSGESLGKRGRGGGSSSLDDPSNHHSSNTTDQELRKDWERIEAMAAAGRK